MMAIYIEHAGNSVPFEISYIASESLDNANVLIMLTMLNNKMTLETRGTIGSIAQVVLALAGAQIKTLNAGIL